MRRRDLMLTLASGTLVSPPVALARTGERRAPLTPLPSLPLKGASRGEGCDEVVE